MKKFVTAIPLQMKKELSSSVYQAVGNKSLQYDKEIAFPIIAVMNAYVAEGETAEILAIKQNDKRTDRNYEIFKEQVEAFMDDKKCMCRITVISVPYEEVVDTHLYTFAKLIEKIEEGDELYACMTYGSKPVPIVEMLALNYAYQVMERTSVECVVYGQFNHETGDMKIYDVSSLFFMDEIVKRISDLKPSDPLGYIRTVLDMEN